jgi:hypothetical protein
LLLLEDVVVDPKLFQPSLFEEEEVVLALKLPHPEFELLLFATVEVLKLPHSEEEVFFIGVVVDDFTVVLVVFGDMTPHPLDPHPLLEGVEVVVEEVFGFMTPHPLEVAVEDLVAEALVGVDHAEKELEVAEEDDIFKLFFLLLAFLFIISEKFVDDLLLKDEVLKDAYLSLLLDVFELVLREKEPNEEIDVSIFVGDLVGDLAIGLEGAGGAGISHPSAI